MTYEFIQEITDDWKSEFTVPCHIYILQASKCVGYIPQGTKKIQMFSMPWNSFDKHHRKFRKLTKQEIQEFS